MVILSQPTLIRQTWRELPFATYLLPGSLGRFLGFTSALISGMYAYTGTEMGR